MQSFPQKVFDAFFEEAVGSLLIPGVKLISSARRVGRRVFHRSLLVPKRREHAATVLNSVPDAKKLLNSDDGKACADEKLYPLLALAKILESQRAYTRFREKVVRDWIAHISRYINDEWTPPDVPELGRSDFVKSLANPLHSCLLQASSGGRVEHARAENTVDCLTNVCARLAFLAGNGGQYYRCCYAGLTCCILQTIRFHLVNMDERSPRLKSRTARLIAASFLLEDDAIQRANGHVVAGMYENLWPSPTLSAQQWADCVQQVCSIEHLPAPIRAGCLLMGLCRAVAFVRRWSVLVKENPEPGVEAMLIRDRLRDLIGCCRNICVDEGVDIGGVEQPLRMALSHLVEEMPEALHTKEIIKHADELRTVLRDRELRPIVDECEVEQPQGKTAEGSA